MLSSTDPTTAIKEVQKRGALAVRVAQRTVCYQARLAVCTVNVYLPLKLFLTFWCPLHRAAAATVALAITSSANAFCC